MFNRDNFNRLAFNRSEITEYIGTGVLAYSGTALVSIDLLSVTSGGLAYSGAGSYILGFAYIGNGQFIYSGNAVYRHTVFYSKVSKYIAIYTKVNKD